MPVFAYTRQRLYSVFSACACVMWRRYENSFNKYNLNTSKMHFMSGFMCRQSASFVSPEPEKIVFIVYVFSFLTFLFTFCACLSSIEIWEPNTFRLPFYVQAGCDGWRGGVDGIFVLRIVSRISSTANVISTHHYLSPSLSLLLWSRSYSHLIINYFLICVVSNCIT